MVLQILLGTPTWVWALLALLVWLGLVQSRARSVPLHRVIVLPLAMTGISIYGTYSTIQAVPLCGVLWLGAAVATAAWFASSDLPPDVHFDATQRRFQVPGSWEPMALMMAIFGTRYAVAVTLALHPQWTREVAVTAIVASIYGALSGVFVGRMLRMLRATREAPTPTPAASSVGWG
ncbi:MAG: hypothetical protein LH632_11665 [Rhodoferax sp.]|nr:hypothetical protein [Rhodoferax sp.]